MFSSLNAPFIGISQLRGIVLQIAINGMVSVKVENTLGRVPNRSNRRISVQRNRGAWILCSAALRATDCAGKSVAERSAGDAILGDYGGNVAVGGYVERYVRGADVWGGAYAGGVGDFRGGALFDGDLVARGQREIDGGDGGGDVEGDVVFFRQDCDSVRANLVSGVAIRGYSVGAHDYGTNAAGPEEVAHHVVGDQRERDTFLIELPGSQARALQIGARFGNENFDLITSFDRYADHAERGADSGGGERAGIALGHDAAGFGHERGAELSDAAVSGAAFFVNEQRFLHHGCANSLQVGCAIP